MPNWTDDTINELIDYVSELDPYAYTSISEAIIAWMRDNNMDTSYAGELEIVIEAAYQCGRDGIFAR